MPNANMPHTHLPTAIPPGAILPNIKTTKASADIKIPASAKAPNDVKILGREKMKLGRENTSLRARSGNIDVNDPLVSFLYDLLRDHLAPGLVERLVQEAVTYPNVMYTNGYIAKYCQDLAARLRGETT